MGYSKDDRILDRIQKDPIRLTNGSQVHIIGGGPAGSFFAIQLLQMAKKVGKEISVTIIDKRIVKSPRNIPWRLKGCNFCAGVISPNLYKEMLDNDVELPEEIICEKFSHIWMHGLWKNFPLKVPPDRKLISVFRGCLPSDRQDGLQGFDHFLISRAVKEGAGLLSGTALNLKYGGSGKLIIQLKASSGVLSEFESDFVCMSTGINYFPGKPLDKNPLFNAFKKINPSFMPPRVRPTFVFEMKPGRVYLKKFLDKELYLIVSGSKQLELEHIALVPKGEYLTVALVGKSIDRAIFPGDADKLIKKFLALPHVQTILPQISPTNTPITCSCNPFTSVAPAVNPFEDRVAVIGDALGARLYRDGIYSAFVSAKILSQTVVHSGVDKKSLQQAGESIVRWLEKDNQACKTVFNLFHKVLKSDVLSRIVYQTFATEMKFKRMDAWPLGNVLWKIGSGSADYGKIIKELISIPVICSFLIGSIKTFRNILTEHFFDLRWGAYGRYPTVILKDKRAAIKKSIEKPLKIKLGMQPEMERMYAIKIRAKAGAIFNELARFGEPDAGFLKLRFVEVRRTAGYPNQKGSEVTYQLRRTPISMRIRLTRILPNKILFYKPEDLFTENGVLLFDISPTKDGNNRLVIYTAFDYKKGKQLPAKIFFSLFKWVFPEYAHDVVWNHAICALKAAAERQALCLID